MENKKKYSLAVILKAHSEIFIKNSGGQHTQEELDEFQNQIKEWFAEHDKKKKFTRRYNPGKDEE